MVTVHVDKLITTIRVLKIYMYSALTLYLEKPNHIKYFVISIIGDMDYLMDMDIMKKQGDLTIA